MSSRTSNELARYLGLIPKQTPKDLLVLGPHDRCIVLGHLQGKTVKELCEELDTNPNRVYRVLKSTAAQNIITDFFQFQDQELKVLYTLAVDAIRTGLKSIDPDIRLRAADRYFKIHGKYKGETPRETAEDVVKRMMEITEKTTTGTRTVKLVEERSSV